jgi:ABC-type uncharacterized transport system substrate-binding protein
MHFGQLKQREFMTLLGGAASSWAWPFVALAQAPARRPRISVLWGSQPRAAAKVADAFIEGMRALGYSEGHHFEMENRWAEGNLERLPALAEEIIRRGTDVIVAANPQAAIAAKDATKTIPIVCALLDDPVGLGLIKSDSKPGGACNWSSSRRTIEFRPCTQDARMWRLAASLVTGQT